MTHMKYVAFLRGINVGGKSMVKMADLKKLFESLEFTNVKTLLNSGNVIFEASSSKSLAQNIETALEKKYGRQINVIIRSIDQIDKLVKSAPFKDVTVTPGVRLYTSFLDTGEIHTVLHKEDVTTDIMDELAKKHGKRITTRNWNTVLKLFS